MSKEEIIKAIDMLEGLQYNIWDEIAYYYKGYACCNEEKHKYDKDFASIKQVLQNVKEPKKDYLKWSQIRDLPMEFKVKMGNDIYIVKWVYWGATDIEVSLLKTNGFFMFNLHESFIENLHLEVIEE